MREIDPLINAAIDIFSENSDADVPDSEDDTFEKFLRDRELAAKLGDNGTAVVAGLKKQTALADARFLRRFDHFEVEEETLLPILDEVDSELLQKSASDPSARRMFGLREWIKKSLADGQTVEELVSYAEGNGFHTQAQEIRKAAQGL